MQALRAGWGVVVLLTICSCSGSKPAGDLPPLVRVQGQVFRGGSPVTAGLLRFIPDPETPESRDWVINAEIQADGTFEVQTLHSVSQKRGKGAPSGMYKVTFTSSGDQTQGARLEFLKFPQKVTIQSDTPNLQLMLPPKQP